MGSDPNLELRPLSEAVPDYEGRILRYGLPPWPIAVAPALGARLDPLPGALWEMPGFRAYLLWRDSDPEPLRILAENDGQAIRAARACLAGDPAALAQARALLESGEGGGV